MPAPQPHLAQPVAVPLNLGRHNMVNNQLKPNGIRNLAVRHRFNVVVREDYTATPGLAYRDAGVPQASPNRELFSPLVEAKLIHALNVQPTESVLVLGAGSGYGAAILAGLAAHVTLMEDDPQLRALASHNLVNTPELTAQITFLGGPVPTLTETTFSQLPAGSCPVVLLDAAADALPPVLKTLVPAGGRVAAVVPDHAGIPAACLFIRDLAAASGWQTEILLETTAPVLPAWALPTKFVF